MSSRFDLALGKAIPAQIDFPGTLRDFFALYFLDKIDKIEKNEDRPLSAEIAIAYLNADELMDARTKSHKELEKIVEDYFSSQGGEEIVSTQI